VYWKVNEQMARISVITVCYNAQDTIEKTICSVIDQEDADFEYLIQDGGSKDNTLDIIDKYNKYDINVESIKDYGLYDAMNKAVSRANGDYIIFLNSGDVFCDNKVLYNITKELLTDIVMGNVIRLTNEGKIKESYQGKHTVFNLLLSGRMPCHQVIFSKRKLLMETPFDLSYNICADFNFMVQCCKKKCSMHYADIDVSIVDCVEGISSQKENLEEMRRQDDRSLKENFPIWYYIIKIPKGIGRCIKRINEEYNSSNTHI
jgi:glycosyltransferase involved in cell wall biosynthesis